MRDYKELIEVVKVDLLRDISPKRVGHILGVVEYAKLLGKHYSLDLDKLELAALLHDIAKELTLDEMRELLKDTDFKELEGYEEMGEILHGFAGAELAKKRYLVEDIDILDSIRYHTIGKKDMSLFQLVIYIADGVEFGRKYPEVEKIRETLNVDIYKGVLHEVNHKIIYLLEIGAIIHTNTVELRNWLLSN